MLGFRRISPALGGIAVGMPPSKTMCRRHFRGLMEAPLLSCLTLPPLPPPSVLFPLFLLCSNSGGFPSRQGKGRYVDQNRTA
jgi:hypothetical protein